MSRRKDLLEQLLQSDKFGEDKENEQKFLAATAELILTDLVNIALNGIEKHGAGTLVINLENDSTTYMSGSDIEEDIYRAEVVSDDEVLVFLRDIMEKIDTNDWNTNVLISLISNAGTRTFSLKAGGCQESLRALTSEFSG